MTYSSAIGYFTIGDSPIGGAAPFVSPYEVFSNYTPPLQTIIPSYAYEQYQDDANIQAFVTAFNTLAQGYLNWFNSTPLALYTSPNITGPLLDWTATGIYGIPRPTLSNFQTKHSGGYGSVSYGAASYGRQKTVTSGTATLASDDIYKRVLTWWLYKGDGQIMTLQWLKRRAQRFMHGANGGNATFPVKSPPSVTIAYGGIQNGGYGSVGYGKASYGRVQSSPSSNITIQVANNAVGQALQLLMQDGLLAVPFQNKVQVVL